MEYEGLNLKAKYLKKSNGVPDNLYTPSKTSRNTRLQNIVI